RNHRIDLGPDEHEVTGDRGLAAAGWLEVDGRHHTHRSDRRELHSALIDGITPGHSERVDTAIARLQRRTLLRSQTFRLEGAPTAAYRSAGYPVAARN